MKLHMASKRRVRRRSCEGKRQYASANIATASSRRLTGVGTGNLHAYRCKFCRQWHTGHRPYKFDKKMEGVFSKYDFNGE